MPGSVHIVMPAHNEAKVIASVLHRVRGVLPDARILVVNDGSDDNTAREAAAAGATVINLPFNCGYGVALHTGLTSAFRSRAEIVLTMDADGQHEADSIPALMEPVLKQEADLVLGSRYLPGSVTPRVPTLRRITSWCLAWLLTAISRQPFSDTTTGFQCMNSKTLGEFVRLKDFPERTPDADLILYAIMRGCRVREVPVIMHEDAGGESMHGLFKSMFYVPKLFTAILSVILGYTCQRKG